MYTVPYIRVRGKSEIHLVLPRIHPCSIFNRPLDFAYHSHLPSELPSGMFILLGWVRLRAVSDSAVQTTP